MGELAPEVAEMAALRRPPDLVWPVLLEPALGLAPAEAGPAGHPDAGAAGPGAPRGSPGARQAYERTRARMMALNSSTARKGTVAKASAQAT